MPSSFYVLLRRMRMPLIVLILMYAISIVGLTLIPGQDAQGKPWSVSFFHALYVVSYTASTIGFGEIPYAFTDAQRLWMVFVIHLTVIGWLYSIGTLLGVLQDPAFRKLSNEYLFQKRVKRIRTPFYIVCGYGDTGSILVKALAQEGIKAVVLDKEESRIQELELNDYMRSPIGLVADAAKPAMLDLAGVTHAYCVGVVALTDSDVVNLMTALSARLLKTDIKVLARAESAEVVTTLQSFERTQVIDPFATFANRLAMAIHSPGLYTLFTWLTSIPHEALQEIFYPKKGLWIICGFGRFGQALYTHLHTAGIPTRVIEADRLKPNMPEHTLFASGKDVTALLAVDIKQAVGIVAGTDNDADNLSILIAARQLNPNIIRVARQNQRDNGIVFERAKFDLVMKRGDVIAHKIFAFLRTPLISDFLNVLPQQTNQWANELVSRIVAISDDEVPYFWEVRINKMHTPALYAVLHTERPIQLLDLMRSPVDRSQPLAIIPLLLKRHNRVTLLPPDEKQLAIGDRLLMCGTYAISREMEWATQNDNVLQYLLTGLETSGGDLLHRLWQRNFSKP